MVRKWTNQNVPGLDVVKPRVWATHQVYAGCKRPVTFGPREATLSRMQDTPNIHNTTLSEEGQQSFKTLPRGIKDVRATSIQGPVKHRVEITTQQSGHQRVNTRLTERKEVITIGVPVWSI